jgi:hypothetical protein
MTTFTSEDREEEYKKIVEKAPYQPGYEDAVPIPFAGWVVASPPHIVDSGASVMVKELTDDEIHELANEHLRTQNQDGAKVVLGLEDFARAILRKAQEK